ncbi:hypothetical protein [Okeania sp. SIO2C2]|nr:hypothetical protein [Okeania sp. SIO2C2]
MMNSESEDPVTISLPLRAANPSVKLASSPGERAIASVLSFPLWV